MKNKKKAGPPPPYATETRDQRFAGTFEVLVPVEGRNKPHKIGRQFDSLKEAEAWLHSADGQDEVTAILKA